MLLGLWLMFDTVSLGVLLTTPSLLECVLVLSHLDTWEPIASTLPRRIQ